MITAQEIAERRAEDARRVEAAREEGRKAIAEIADLRKSGRRICDVAHITGAMRGAAERARKNGKQ